MKYMNRRFSNMKRGRGSKLMMMGIIVRVILVLVLFAGGRIVCDNLRDDAKVYYDERGY